eukprot:6480942-Amphidinium_carterae.1
MQQLFQTCVLLTLVPNLEEWLETLPEDDLKCLVDDVTSAGSAKRWQHCSEGMMSFSLVARSPNSSGAAWQPPFLLLSRPRALD